MREFLRSTLATFLLLCSLSSMAADGRDEVAIPALKARVTDLTATLSQEQQYALESKLAAFEQEKGSQIAILIVPTTQPEDIAQYSIRVVDEWKIGREKIDDGILVLVAKNDRKMRIEVGYGLEGVIPDAIAKRIVAEVMAPHFKQGDFYGGLDAATNQIIHLISGEQLPPPKAKASGDWMHALPFLLIFGLIFAGMLRMMFGSFFGSAINGGIIGFLVFVLGGSVLFAIVLAVIAFLISISGIFPNSFGSGGFGGGSGGFGGGSGGFSGGGGGFGGGGASGDW